jgi:hypothetical protein
MSKDKYKITKSIEQPKKKRIRRTREQLIAAGYYDKDHRNKAKKPKIAPHKIDANFIRLIYSSFIK